MRWMRERKAAVIARRAEEATVVHVPGARGKMPFLSLIINGNLGNRREEVLETSGAKAIPVFILGCGEPQE